MRLLVAGGAPVNSVRFETENKFMLGKTGFTLIELSIIIVIIGLIVGGIMVGGSLIRQAEIRSALGDFEKINSAMNVFRQKYNCMAGDCMNATDYFPVASCPRVSPAWLSQ